MHFFILCLVYCAVLANLGLEVRDLRCFCLDMMDLESIFQSMKKTLPKTVPVTGQHLKSLLMGVIETEGVFTGETCDMVLLEVGSSGISWRVAVAAGG